MEQLRGVSSQLPLGTNEAVERLARDAQFGAQVADLGRNGGRPYTMTPAKLRLAQAAMAKPRACVFRPNVITDSGGR